MSSYTVVLGDNTFDTVSRKVYGQQAGAGRIRKANPQATEPLAVGAKLIIPVQPVIVPPQIEEQGDGVHLRIDGITFEHWSAVTISRSFDAIDTFTVKAPHDLELDNFSSTFEPFTYKEVQIWFDGKLLFTGTMVDVVPELTANSSTIHANGYSLGGVLWDCSMMGGTAAVEFNNLTFDQIAADIVEPFGLRVKLLFDAGPRIAQVAARPDENVGSFLTKLAKQNGFVIGNDEHGLLNFRRDDEVTGDIVASFVEGEQPMLSCSPRFNARQFYSSITGYEPATLAGVGGNSVVTNPYVTVPRPHNFMVNDVKAGEVKKATDARMGRMFANACMYEVELPTWHNENGNVWEAGQKVKIHAPSVMIYEPYVFTIRTVTLMVDETGYGARLLLIIPKTLSGIIPDELPWRPVKAGDRPATIPTGIS